MYYQSMPLYLRLTELLKVEYRLVCNFPKQYKYSLGEDLVSITWEMLDLFIEAQTCPACQKEHKIEVIHTLHQKHDCLKLRVRFCGELKLVTIKQQSLLNKDIVEIGKMIGSWQKNV